MAGIWFAYAAALSLGVAHALEADHVVAVSTFVSSRPVPGAAVGFGIRWGIGHSAVVVIIGAVVAWTGMTLPRQLALWAELAVGLTILGLGIWATRTAHRLPQRVRSAAGVKCDPHERRSRLLCTGVGAVHGLAGSTPVVALIPVTLLPDFRTALGYLIAFSVGTVLGMACYAALAALAVSRAAFSRTLVRATALASVLVGLLWTIRAANHLTA
ncbi:MAG: hypothetical protein ACE5HT_04765 [Gemmatimonadales bacterium]